MGPLVDESAVDMAFRHARLALINRIVFAQRMADEFVVEQDSPQIWMIG